MIKFVKLYPRHYWIEKDGQKIGELTQNSYGRSLWNIEINGKRILDKSGYDCFSLNIAKQIVREKINT